MRQIHYWFYIKNYTYPTLNGNNTCGKLDSFNFNMCLIQGISKLVNFLTFTESFLDFSSPCYYYNYEKKLNQCKL